MAVKVYAPHPQSVNTNDDHTVNCTDWCNGTEMRGDNIEATVASKPVGADDPTMTLIRNAGSYTDTYTGLTVSANYAFHLSFEATTKGTYVIRLFGDQTSGREIAVDYVIKVE